MKAFLRPRFKLLAAGFALLVLAATASTALLAGKPAPAPPPPVLYAIHFWDMPSAYTEKLIRKINNPGQVVGYYFTTAQEQRGFLYDPAINFNLSAAIDLNAYPGIAGIPHGWVIASASDINDNGVIVGYLLPAGYNATNAPARQGYVLDTKAQPPTVTPLPAPKDPSGNDWPNWYCNRINNNGDILVAIQETNYVFPLYIYRWGTLGQPTVDQHIATSYPAGCRMNKYTLVAGMVYDSTGLTHYCRWDALAGTFNPILIPVATSATYTVVWDMNDSGWVCGSAVYIARNGSTSTYPCRYDFKNPLTVWSAAEGNAYAINSDADLFCDLSSGKSYPCYVYQDRYGFLNVDSLIDPGDPNAKVWSSKSSYNAVDMNNRIGTPGFGQLVGLINWGNGSQSCYLLTPK